MRERDASKRVLGAALLVTLFIWLLACVAAGETTVHAGRLNQTVPTPTPYGMPVTRPTSLPARSRPGPSVTPILRPSALASPLPAGQPSADAPPATATAGRGTLLPIGTPEPSRDPAVASAQPSPSPSPSGTLRLSPWSLPFHSPSPQGSASTPTPASPSLPDLRTTLCSLPCLWLVGGGILMVAGIVVLVRRRRLA